MKKYNLYFIAFLLCVPTLFHAQESIVQWASEVKSFSSQYGSKDYSAKQALGVPNAIYNPRLHHMAWVPKRENSPLGEYIQVAFDEPMRIQQVGVAESLNPGAVKKITLIDTNGKKHQVYENKKFKVDFFNRARIFRHKFPLTSYKVAQVRIDLNTKAIEGSNQIDAIAISTSRDNIKARVEEVTYEEEVAKAEHLGNVNSMFAERLPIISPDGNTLYFAVKYHPKNIGEKNNDDIWVSKKQPDGTWSRASNVGTTLNNAQHNFVVSVSPTGDRLYLGSDYQKKLKDGVSMAKLRGQQWAKPNTMNVKNHYNGNDFVCYHVNTDGNVLLMSVEREDGLGDLDLYVSFKLDGNQWTEPVNLGPQVNSIGSESSVFIAADNRTIYFSSNGHAGYGGFDMFMTRRLDETWTKWSAPKNLGKQINTKGNDYNYTIPASGEYAYFSRENGQFMSDLYRIKLPKEVQPEPVMLMTGRIIDAETLEPIPTKLKYEKLKQQKENETGSNEGEFQIVVPYGDDVAVHAEAEGYFAVSESLELSDEALEEEDYDIEKPKEEEKEEENSYKEVEKDILMVPLKKGQIIPMNNVFFAANQSDLKPESSSELNRVLRFLKKHNNIIVEVGGHTNGWCSPEYAAKLSSDRAKEVRAYFIKSGIPEKQIQSRGYGKRKPIATNQTPSGRKQNQRVELKIVEILE